MKRIRPLETAPAGLTTFVQNAPEERDWEAFRSFERGIAYKELLAALVERQHGLCCYCEIDLKEHDWQVEHFHPKRDTESEINRTTDHTNLLAACLGGHRKDIWGAGNPSPERRDVQRHRDPTQDNLSCGQAKDRLDPAKVGTSVIDPRTLPAVPSALRVKHDGALDVDPAVCRDQGLAQEKVQESIRILGLECVRLQRAREDKLRHLAEAWADWLTNADVLLAAARAELLPDSQGRLARFFTTSRSFFGQAAEIVLTDPPQAWI